MEEEYFRSKAFHGLKGEYCHTYVNAKWPLLKAVWMQEIQVTKFRTQLLGTDLLKSNSEYLLMNDKMKCIILFELSVGSQN